MAYMAQTLKVGSWDHMPKFLMIVWWLSEQCLLAVSGVYIIPPFVISFLILNISFPVSGISRRLISEMQASLWLKNGSPYSPLNHQGQYTFFLGDAGVYILAPILISFHDNFTLKLSKFNIFWGGQ